MLSYEETRNLCFVFKTNSHLISEKVTYVHQDRENQRQPFFSEKYTTFFLKMNYLFLIIGCHHFFPKRVFFYSKQPK